MLEGSLVILAKQKCGKEQQITEQDGEYNKCRHSVVYECDRSKAELKRKMAAQGR